MKSLSLLQKILLGLLAVLIIMQFFQIDKTNPPVEPNAEFIAMTNPPAEVQNLLKKSCYDCHSHETKYPWYTNVAPVSWWIKHHIDDGRKHLNFSSWGSYDADRKAHKLEECYEEVEKGNMPMESYLIMHGEAKMTDDEKSTLINWFKSMHQEES